MQRRAATAYVLLFLVIGAGSYGLIATAEQPEVSFDDPEHRLSAGDQFSVDGRQYTVADVRVEEEGDGHGGTSVTYASTLRWTNDSARYTETWAEGDTVTVDGFEGEVRVPNESDPREFSLVDPVNRTAILRDDPNADNETVTRNGEAFVVVTEEGETRLVAASTYFPAPERQTIAAGTRVDYAGNRTTVGNVTSDGVPVSWIAPRTDELSLSHESNVTLAGQQFFVYFTGDSTVVLESDYAVYDRQTEEMAQQTRITNGLWGVSILSGLTAAVLVGMAFLPSRY